jgi:CHAT domain-containing protein
MVAERDKNPKLPWSEALRRAFGRVVNEVGHPSFAHPSNWAAFALVGAEAAQP